MTYLPDMEQIPSDMLEQVLAETKAYDYDSFTESDVRNALAKERRTLKDFQALLSPAAFPFLGGDGKEGPGRDTEIFRKILSVCLLRSILANYCENYCIYCGFNCHNHIRRHS